MSDDGKVNSSERRDLRDRVGGLDGPLDICATEGTGRSTVAGVDE